MVLRLEQRGRARVSMPSDTGPGKRREKSDMGLMLDERTNDSPLIPEGSRKHQKRQPESMTELRCGFIYRMQPIIETFLYESSESKAGQKIIHFLLSGTVVTSSEIVACDWPHRTTTQLSFEE